MRLSASLCFSLVLGLAVCLSAPPSKAQDNPYAPGWDMDQSASKIEFGSVKYEDGKEVIETHSFATFAGSIEDTGATQITVKLDSVNTNNDLRNVRMRFLFFETFKYPDAVVTTVLTPEMASGLAVGDRKALTIPFDFDIHGAKNRMVADAVVEVVSPTRIRVSSAQSLIFAVEDFGLQNNLTKIAETAGGFRIIPKMTIDFDFSFDRRAGQGPSQVEQIATLKKEDVVQDEGAGEFTYDQCIGRFEILSETGNIYFDSGSARLKPDSSFVLGEVIDIIQRCPSMRILIAGHTDSDGGAGYNQQLSESRAQSVVSYLVGAGVNRSRLITAGFGEERPMVPNDNDFNKSRNRRIEFSLFR